MNFCQPAKYCNQYQGDEMFKLVLVEATSEIERETSYSWWTANWTTSSSPNLDSLQQLLFSNWYDNDRFIFSRYAILYWTSQLKGEFYQTCRNIYEVIRNSYFENESQFFWDSKFTWTVNKSLKPFWSINSSFQIVHRLFFKYILLNFR